MGNIIRSWTSVWPFLQLLSILAFVRAGYSVVFLLFSLEGAIILSTFQTYLYLYMHDFFFLYNRLSIRTMTAVYLLLFFIFFLSNQHSFRIKRSSNLRFPFSKFSYFQGFSCRNLRHEPNLVVF